MMFKTIRQTIVLSAAPSQLYETILDPEKHAEFTQAAATNDKKAGGKFTAYDGYISGTNLELVKNRKIVQRWTAADLPKGVFTEVTFEFKKHEKGTELVFTQKNVPEKSYKELTQGWKDYYWKPLKAAFSGI
jgi:activator of HSP90 ATPase